MLALATLAINLSAPLRVLYEDDRVRIVKDPTTGRTKRIYKLAEEEPQPTTGESESKNYGLIRPSSLDYKKVEDTPKNFGLLKPATLP